MQIYLKNKTVIFSAKLFSGLRFKIRILIWKMIHIPENMIKKYLLLLSKTVHYVLELAGLLSAWGRY